MPSPHELRYRYHDTIREGCRLTYGENNSRQIAPCEQITDPELLIGLIGYNRLQPKRMLIHGARDRQPISLTDPNTGHTFQITYPGKSAFLYFGDEPAQYTISGVVQKSLQRERKPADHLHLSSVGALLQAGWQAWWTPLPDSGNWGHVRLVPNCIVDEGRDPTLDEAAALTRSFVRTL